MNTLYVASTPFNLFRLGLDAPQCSITFMSDIALHTALSMLQGHQLMLNSSLQVSEDQKTP